jgi:hypothetical protein
VRDTIALRCEPLRRASSGASALKRRSGLPKRSTRQSKSERGVVNERNVCSQSATKAASTQLASGSRRCSKSAHALPPSMADSLPAALETARRSSRRSAYVTRARGRRGPLQKLRDAPRAVEAAERAIVEPGVEPIANTNRIVPAVGGEARDKRKRVTFAHGGRRSRRSSRCRCRPALSRRRAARGPAQRTRRTTAWWLAPRRNASASTVSTARRTIGSTSSFSNTHQQYASALKLVNNHEQQHAEHTSLANSFHCFLSW